MDRFGRNLEFVTIEDASSIAFKSLRLVLLKAFSLEILPVGVILHLMVG